MTTPARASGPGGSAKPPLSDYPGGGAHSTHNSGSRRARTAIVLIALAVILIAAAAAALLVGAAETTSVIVTEIRAPRIALTLIVGAGLGISGALLQGTLRNPLADPGIIGVSASAALGAVATIAIAAAVRPAVSGSVWLTAIGATVAGIAGMALVLWIARSASGRTEVVTLVLGGVAVTAFAAAVLSVVVAVSDDAGARSTTFWTTGSLALATWPGVWSTLPFLALAVILAALVARDRMCSPSVIAQRGPWASLSSARAPSPSVPLSSPSPREWQSSESSHSSVLSSRTPYDCSSARVTAVCSSAPRWRVPFSCSLPTRSPARSSRRSSCPSAS